MTTLLNLADKMTSREVGGRCVEEREFLANFARKFFSGDLDIHDIGVSRDKTCD